MSVASNKNIESYIKEELTSLYGDEGWKQIYDNSPLLLNIIQEKNHHFLNLLRQMTLNKFHL